MKEENWNLEESEKYKIALAEVDDVLRFTDNSILSKIPESLKKFISENKMENYITNINPYMQLKYQKISEEAKAILSIIYQNYGI